MVREKKLKLRYQHQSIFEMGTDQPNIDDDVDVDDDDDHFCNENIHLMLCCHVVGFWVKYYLRGCMDGGWMWCCVYLAHIQTVDEYNMEGQRLEICE